MTRIAIVGNGFVGAGMLKIFPEARVIDPPKGIGSLEDATDCEMAIVCVPTPRDPITGQCVTGIVEEVVRALPPRPLILIKSTVEPGTTQRLMNDTRRPIVFSPEYMGESRYWTPPEYPAPDDPIGHRFMIIGGYSKDCSRAADVFLPRLGPATRFRFMSATEAELVKYAENCFFALKVTFANELRRICDRAGVNYHTVREGWLDDPRVGPMHTAAFKDAPGFGGKCLPKDISALAAFCRRSGMPSELLEAVIATNEATSV